MHPLGLRRSDQRADGGGLGARIAHRHGRTGRSQRARQRDSDLGVGIDPLHRHTNLAGMVETALGDQGNNAIQIDIAVDDHRRRAAMLQGAAGAGSEP